MNPQARVARFPIFLLLLLAIPFWLAARGDPGAARPEAPAGLADDESVGKVAEREGMVFLKRALSARWVLARDGAAITPGDQVKTGARGANAAALHLAGGSEAVLGPGGLLEAGERGLLRLRQGDLEVHPAKGTKVRVEGPRGMIREVEAAIVLRAGEESLAVVEKTPAWLAGFRSKSISEGMGSLLAKVDGRDTPLTLGYHKVDVDIRDRIARTVVEESFANHTDSVLEGVFYFPLPQDASISGFAMWIGEELVEADIVEKERAREIFEEILREKRDPGLLEWTGGNLFKARVYPIPAHGEKRIRITYTEVLPREGVRYRYSYSLQSEMLKLNPLRRLQIDLKISSAAAIGSVACPSHTARISRTEHAAQVEFSAEEYTPSRDFEVVVNEAPSGENIRVVTHQRADDGYLMVLLSAAGGGEWLSAAPASKPLDLLLVADTSGSMTDAQIRDQRQFIASLLEALGEKDRFNLLGFDVTAEWAFEKPVPASAGSREKALRFLEKRGSLGWTDLDLAFREAVALAGKESQVVYVGDGIPTRGDPDPAAFAARLKKIYRGEGTFHAVSVGSTYDLTVLRAIAGLGRGSVHRIAGGKGAPEAADDLLREITSPGLRDLALSWNGIRVAGVYPEVLPNLPAGREQVILARYLPQGTETRGRLMVTGTADGKPFSREVPISIPANEEGNSFIPRFWARLHLDHLLAQGPDPQVKERIIALSEDYQIITPYTSFLVLESDADRERFQVKKRLRMRGGEEFFAEGRENARFELSRAEMLKAKRWRAGIRSQVLALYASLGRNLGLEPIDTLRRNERISLLSTRVMFGAAQSGGKADYFMDEKKEYLGDVPASAAPEEAESLESRDFDADGELDIALKDKEEFVQEGMEFEGLPASAPVLMARERFDGAGLLRQNVAKSISYRGRGGRGFNARMYIPPPPPFSSLFPLPGGPRGEFKGRWPAEIRGVIEKLNRRPVLAGIEGGLRISVASESMDTRRRTVPGARSESLIASQAWSAVSQGYPGDIPVLHWLDTERGVVDLARRLGSRRKMEKGDAGSYPSPLGSYFDDLEQTYGAYSPSLTREGDQAVLKLGSPWDPSAETQVIIDLKRSAILQVVSLRLGKVVFTETFGDFVELKGAWWPRTDEVRDHENAVTRVSRIAYEDLTADGFRAALAKSLAPLPDAVLLDLPLSRLVAAKQSALDGKAGLADRWVLLNHFARTQDWGRVKAQLLAIEELARGKSGLVWIRLDVLKASRQNEEARALIADLAKSLAGQPSAGDFGLAQFLAGPGAEPLQDLEKLAVLDVLKPVFERQDQRLFPLKGWSQMQLQALDRLGRSEDAFKLRKDLAAAYPDDVNFQIAWASALVQRGEVESGVGHLDRTLEKNGPFTEDEVSTIRSQAAAFLFDGRRLREFLAYVDGWLRTKPARVGYDLFDRYLSALILLDREEEADGLMRVWLRGGRGPDPDALEDLRLQAAVGHALGQGHALYMNRVEEKWRGLLVEVARALAVDPVRFHLAGRILQGGNFGQTDEGIALARELYLKLNREVSTIHAAVLGSLYNYTQSARLEKGDPTREEFMKAVLARWEREQNLAARQQLESFLAGSGDLDTQIQLRRKQLALAASAEERSVAAGNLFQLLLGKPFDAQVEAEMIQLFPAVGEGEAKLAAQAGAVRQLASWLESARAAKLIEAIPDRNKKSRRELKPLEEAERKKAREEAAAVLARIEKLDLSAGLVPYVKIERLTLEARLGTDTARLFNELSAVYLAVPDRNEEDPLDAMPEALAGRSLLTLGYLATRPKADPDLGVRLLKLLDEAIAAKKERGDPRTEKYRLLVALDRGDDLEKTLAAWAVEAGEAAGNRFRVPLGYVLAERGKIGEAVKVFEALRARDELSPEEHRTLARWYLALGEKEKNRQARIEAHRATEEWQIQNSLSQDLNRYRRTGEAVPEELDEDVLLRFAALIQKSTQPHNHLWILREYYQTTKDFRLLETLSESLVGQTAVKAYDLLLGLGPVLDLVGDEATVDRMEKHLAALHQLSKSDVDRRALRLFEFLVERRAADQANGAGPHAARALQALKDARKGTWMEGERVLMAGLLASVGRLSDTLRPEQLQQLAALHDQERPGSQDRFLIAVHRSSAQWANLLREEAIRVLGAGLGEYREARGGILPDEANQPLVTYGAHLQDLKEHAAAERLWRSELALGHNQARKRWLAIQLYQSLHRAFREGGTAAAGKGEDLYRATRDEILAALAERSDENHAKQLVDVLVQILRAANQKKLKAAGGDLSEFAFGKLPGILAMYQFRNCQEMIRTVADGLREVRGYREAVAFLVARAEGEPSGLRRQGQDFWRTQGHLLTEYRTHVKDLGDLEPRVLAIFLAELRRDLTERQDWMRQGFDQRQSYFWIEKTEDFYRTAMGVLDARQGSRESVKYIASYLFEGLNRHEAAIDALFAFERKTGLDRAGKWQLASFLQRVARFAESIPLLNGMIEEWPDAVEYRAALLLAHFRTGQKEKLAAALAAAEEYFHKEGRWNEGVIAALGAATLETEQFEKSAAFYGEAIPLHRKSAPLQGVGDGTLSLYYSNLARAFAGLGKTREAVDAAAGAIVSWGRRQDQRNEALKSLQEILRHSPDLDGYAALVDREAAEEKLENPIVRKALGLVYLERKEYRKAEKHLQAAVENGPPDAEAFRALIETFDKSGNPAGAAPALLTLARARGHDLALWKELGDRLAKIERPLEAERAYTNLSEVSSGESEGHALLAKLREETRKFDEAAVEWQEVIRVRSREPAGYLGLARALIGGGRGAEARETLKELLGKPWPSRFGDVQGEAKGLMQQAGG